MINYTGVLVLRAEQDELAVPGDPNRVSRWPVEQVPGRDLLLGPVAKGDAQLAVDQVAPVRRLAEVVLEPLQERRDVGPGCHADMGIRR